jgi:hypothetical protein
MDMELAMHGWMAALVAMAAFAACARGRGRVAVQGQFCNERHAVARRR